MRARVLSAPGDTLDVAGLSVGERTRRALGCAGIEMDPEGEAFAPLLLVAGDALVEPALLGAIAGFEASAEMALAIEGDEADPALLRVPPGTPIPRDAAGLAVLAASFRARGLLRSVAPGGARCERVRGREQARSAAHALVAGLARESDSFFARHVDRKLSGPLSIWLVRRGASPNAVTALATAVGLAGAGCLASASRAWQTFGAALFVVSTVLDGCDGEVARLSLRESHFGRTLDLVCDNLVNAAVFVAVGVAGLRVDATGRLGGVVAAGLAGLGFATTMGFAYSAWLERSGRIESLRQSYERLASRDFAYLLLILAAGGRLVWFVWAAAIGSWAFGLLLLALRLAGWPPLAGRAARGHMSLSGVGTHEHAGRRPLAARATPREEATP